MDENKVPGHVAIIMDGNGRWAKKRGLPVIAGHNEGVNRVEDIINACPDMGIKALTLYAFSTENWSRPTEEVRAIMMLFEKYLDMKTQELCDKGVKFNAIGDIEKLSASLKQRIALTSDKTARNTRLTLNVAVNYGSRDEIISAVKRIAGLARDTSLDIERISGEMFSSFLYTAGQPDPDLLIRTSGEMRLSNFLLWQISYAEIYVTDVLWPDFDRHELAKAVEDYSKRQRRYGRRV